MDVTMGMVVHVEGGRRRKGRPRVIRALAAGLSIAFVLSGCSTSHGSTPAAMSLQMTSGSATVAGGGSTRQVSSQAGLGVGYRITVAPGGLAVIHLGPGLTYQIAPGEALITSPSTVQLVSGDVLGQFSAPGEIDSPGITVQSRSGTFRVDAQPERVGVYSGSVTVSEPGASLAVPAYREAVVQNGALPAAPVALQLTQNGDVWDHQFLQPALDLDSQLASFGNGLDAQLGTASGAAFFRSVVPSALDVSYIAPFFPEPRSDVLTGWVIAANAAMATNANLPVTFFTIMELWVQGETWGVIAMEYNVSASAVFAGLQDAIDKLKISLQSPTPQFEAVPAPVASTPVTRSTPAPSTYRIPIVTPIPTPSATLPSLLGGLLNPITSLLGQVLNLLLPAPSPSPSP
jgi:hypothetical protein